MCEAFFFGWRKLLGSATDCLLYTRKTITTSQRLFRCRETTLFSINGRFWKRSMLQLSNHLTCSCYHGWLWSRLECQTLFFLQGREATFAFSRSRRAAVVSVLCERSAHVGKAGGSRSGKSPKGNWTSTRRKDVLLSANRSRVFAPALCESGWNVSFTCCSHLVALLLVFVVRNRCHPDEGHLSKNQPSGSVKAASEKDHCGVRRMAVGFIFYLE